MFLKRLVALVVSAISTGIAASIFSSYRVIIDLRNIGTPVSDGTAASTALYDLQHFAPLLVLFIFIAFLIAFFVASLIYKAVKFGRPVVYIAAGGAAIFVMLYLMKAVFFGVPIVAGARDTTGLLLQILAGGLGGFVFAYMTRHTSPIKKDPSETDVSLSKISAAS